MDDIKLSKPSEATAYPSATINPALKDKKYHVESAKAIWWNCWNSYQNPYGNNFRGSWLDNRAWARGTQSNLQFASRPPAKNDYTKNPLLRHIDFSTVNEMVKYCDIFCSILEENDYDIQATAINPAASTTRNQIKANAQAYMILRPVFEKINQEAGVNVAPPNPMKGDLAHMNELSDFEFENQQELDIFFQIGFKLQQELQAEIGNEVVLNESKWPRIRKMLCEDIRDTGFAIVKKEVDTNNRMRVKYQDPVNSGWEDFRGHSLGTPSRFWTIILKTGAQIAAESGGQLSIEDMKSIAISSNGRYGNPNIATMTSGTNWGYLNSDLPYQGMIWDSWKFPVLECIWEDWDVFKYRSIVRTEDNVQESYSPVNYNYTPKDGEVYNDGGVEKKVRVDSTHVHHYRQCTWIIGTEISYNWGKCPFCPRDPHDIRVALCPVKIYRAAGNPYTQRLKPIAKMAMNAWFKFQNEVAKSKPHAAKINLAAMDNLTTIDGNKITRRQILELYNEDGTILYSDKGAMDDMGITRRPSPIEPIANVDIAAMQRWIDVINFCSLRFEQESGLNEFMNGSTPNPETTATSAKAAVTASSRAFQQYIDALLVIGEDLALDIVGTLQQLVRQGFYLGYQSSIGASLLRNVPITEDITLYTFGIRVSAKPTMQQRAELKASLRAQFSSPTDPTQGSLMAPDLIRLEQMLDSGVNLKIVALMAAYYHRKNMKQMQDAAAQQQQMVTESQQKIAAAAAQNTLIQEQELSKIRVNEYAQIKAIDAQFETHKSQLKTQNQIITNSDKSTHKLNEKYVDAALETA